MDYTANQDTQQCILHLKNKKEPPKKKTERERAGREREGGGAFGKKFRGDGPQNSSHEDPFPIGAACPREQINACDEMPSLGSAARRTGRYLRSAQRYEEGGTERRARAIARVVPSGKPELRPPPPPPSLNPPPHLV